MSAERRPKRLSSIKALVDIQDMSNTTPPTKKHQNKPRSSSSTGFVFLSEDDDNDATPTPTPTSTTPLSSKLKQQQKKNDSLFSQLSSSSRAATTTKQPALLAASWLSKCSGTNTHHAAQADLLRLCVECAGGAVASSSFKKSSQHTLDLMCAAAVFPVKSTTPPQNVSSFFFELGVQSCTKPQYAQDGLCDVALHLCVLASSSSSSSSRIRTVGVLGALQLARGVLSRAAALRVDLERTTTAWEKQAGAGGASYVAALRALLAFSSSKDSATAATSQLDPVLDAVQDALARWREESSKSTNSTEQLKQMAQDALRTARELRRCERMALELPDASAFSQVVQKRFRDVDWQVRAETARQLAALCTGYYRRSLGAVSQRSKYFAWMLFDKHPSVRTEALRALAALGAGGDYLAQFVSKFTPRLQEMVQRDVDEQVRCEALRTVQAWVAAGLLKEDEEEEEESLFWVCEELLFAEEEHVAHAAAQVVLELHGGRLQHADGKVRTRAFCQLVLKHVKSADDDDDATATDGAIEALECVKAMEAFSSSLCPVDAVCDLLLDDAFCELNAQLLPPILCALLLSQLQQPKSGTAGGEVAGRRLVDLLVRFRHSDACVASLLSCLPLVRFPSATGGALLERAVAGELVRCSTERCSPGVLSAAAAALGQLLLSTEEAALVAQQALQRIAGALRAQPVEDAMGRMAALVVGVPGAGELVVLDWRDLVDRVLLREKVDEWLCDAMQVVVFHGGGAGVQDVKLLQRCFAHCFQLLVTAMSTPLGLVTRVLGLFFDCRTLNPPSSSGGWRVPEELVKQADEVFMDMLGRVADSSNEEDMNEFVRDQILLPQARVALFASQFADSKTAAYVLRFVGSAAAAAENDALRGVAIKLNQELRKQNPIRWLMAHLHTILLDTTYADALVKLLGPPSAKAGQQMGEAVSIMVCEAIRVAVHRQDDSVLQSVAPYLAYCKPGTKDRQHVIDLWEKEVKQEQQEDEEEEFGGEFANRLFGRKPAAATPKKRTTTPAAAAAAASKKKKKKQQEEEEEDSVDEEEEERPPSPKKQKRAAAPLQFNKTKTEEEDLERSVFDEEQEEEDKNNSNDEDDFEDDDESEIMGFRPRTTW